MGTLSEKWKFMEKYRIFDIEMVRVKEGEANTNRRVYAIY